MRALELVAQFRCDLRELSRGRDFSDDWGQHVQVPANLAGIEIRPGQVGDQVGGAQVIFHIAFSADRCDRGSTDKMEA